MKIEMKARACQVKDMGDGRVVAVFSTLGQIDKDQDVTLAGAFGEQEVTVVPAHNWGSVPLGKGAIREVGDEAHADLQFNLESATAQEWYSALRFDMEQGKSPLQEWSYGFTVEESEFGDHEGQRVRFLKRMKVHEVSPVLVGAGNNTRTLTVKSAHGQTLAEQIATAAGDVRDLSERVTQIRAIRNAKGKDISEDRLAEIQQVIESMDEVAAAANDLKAAAMAPDVRDQMLREAMRFEASKAAARR